MSRVSPSLRLAMLATAAASLLAACSDAPTGTLTRRSAQGLLRTTVPGTPQKSTVCKVGPAGNYTFTISSTPDALKTDGWNGTALVTNPFTVAAGSCVDIFQGAAGLDLIYVTEINLPAGISLDHIVLQAKGGDCATDSFFCPITITGKAFASFETFVNLGYTVTFYNKGETPPPPSGSQGCTPGYWKNHLDTWSHTPYTTGQSFNTVFGVVGNPNAFNPDKTLLQALENGGGALDALGRHAVAGLLSSSYGLNYGMTPAQVIQAVHDAIVSGNYETTKNLLDGLNNQRCPLN